MGRVNGKCFELFVYFNEFIKNCISTFCTEKSGSRFFDKNFERVRAAQDLQVGIEVFSGVLRDNSGLLF